MSHDLSRLERMPMPTLLGDVRMSYLATDPEDNSVGITEWCNGKAWRIDIERVREVTRADLKVTNTKDALIDWWIIEAPWAHPFWHSYSLTCVHMRPGEFLRSTKRYVPFASHEFQLYALDPHGNRAKMFDMGFSDHSCLPLEPCNFVAQFIEANDDEARQRIEDTVCDVIDGKLNPDTDFLKQWVARFGDAMVKK